jgi:hypothetical protein
MLRRSAFEIVILGQGDEPDVGIVQEGLKIRATKALALLAGGRHGLVDRRQIDRAEVPHEERICGAQPDCADPQGSSFACVRRTSDGVADGDQAVDDADVLRGDALRPLAVAHSDGLRLAADDLDERTLVDG